jgi:protein-tyrosine phosphatase
MEIFKIDEQGLLYIGPDIDEWENLNSHDIHVIFDLDDDLDIGIPEIPDQLLYIYFPFEDRELPNLTKLHENAKLGASLIKQGYRVLCHCGMGHNRSALLAGLILTYLGMSGEEAVELIRKQRMGALYNKTFATYLQGQPSQNGAIAKLQNHVST